jgi:hypothetical protein
MVVVVQLLLRDFLREQHCVDVRKDTSSRNGDTAEELVQLLVVLDRQSDVAGHDTALLVVAGSVPSELQDLGAEVLEDGRKVYRGTGTHTGSVLALTKVTADTTDGKLKTSLGRRSGGLLLAAAALALSSSCCCSFSRHDCL